MAQPPAAQPPAVSGNQNNFNNNNSSASQNNNIYGDVTTLNNKSITNTNSHNNSNNETNTNSGKSTQIKNSGEGDFTGDVDASSKETISQEEKDRPLTPLPLSRISAAAQFDCFRSYICDVHIRGINDLVELLGAHYVTFNFASKEYIRMEANQCDQNRILNNYTKNKLFDLSYFHGYCNNLAIRFVWLTATGSRTPWGHVTVLPVFGGQLDRAMRELSTNGFKLSKDARFDVKNSSSVFKWFNSNDSSVYTGTYYDKDGNRHSSLPLAPDLPVSAFPLAPSKPIEPWVAGFLKIGDKNGNNNDNNNNKNDNDDEKGSGKGFGFGLNSNDNSNAMGNGNGNGNHGGRRVNVPKRGSSLLEPNRKPPRWRRQNGANHSRDKKGPKTSKAKQEQRDSPLGNGKKTKSFKKTGKPKPKSKGKSKAKSKSKSKKSGNNGVMSTAESPAQSESESRSHSESADVNEEEED